jgi:hypothetical protein
MIFKIMCSNLEKPKLNYPPHPSSGVFQMNGLDEWYIEIDTARELTYLIGAVGYPITVSVPRNIGHPILEIKNGHACSVNNENT